MLRRQIGTMQDLMNVARARRMELGLSQADLAARIGASCAWVNSFERGKRTVELAIVFRLFEALDIAVEVMDAADRPAPQPAAGPRRTPEEVLRAMTDSLAVI